MCLYEDNHLFLGSRLGNSLLLRFSQKDEVPTINLNGMGEEVDDDEVIEIPQSENSDSQPPDSKKRRMDTLGILNIVYNMLQKKPFKSQKFGISFWFSHKKLFQGIVWLPM